MSTTLDQWVVVPLVAIALVAVPLLLVAITFRDRSER